MRVRTYVPKLHELNANYFTNFIENWDIYIRRPQSVIHNCWLWLYNAVPPSFIFHSHSRDPNERFINQLVYIGSVMRVCHVCIDNERIYILFWR